MIAFDGKTETAALDELQTCLQGVPDNELLPLLALSVLASRTPFNATKVGSLAFQMSRQFAASANVDAADNLLKACAASFERCGAFQAAADLREGRAILRIEHR